ncbi:MAG: Ig-like domain-containing protein [Flavipsychrobacter sp.]|nr:Ig-like domain-containing protein [Flavipsychrobacter sp.]
MKNVLLAFLLLFATYVNATPTPPLSPVTGTYSVCTGSTTALGHATSGGSWSSSNTAVATVNPTTGVVSGVAAGTADITYTLGVDFASATITVNASPSPIVGSDAFCDGTSTIYTSTPSGGTWSNLSLGTVFSIDTSTGLAIGVSPDTTTLIYKLSNTCSVTKLVTVILGPAPSITGPDNICMSVNATLSNFYGGGVWTSSDPAVATVGSSSGTVSGVAVGTAGITYTLSTGCTSAKVVTVGVMPAAITGTTTVCEGATTPLSSTTSGGSWTSGIPSVASVDAVTGVVTGVSAGVVVITYSVGACSVTSLVTVNALPFAGGILGSDNVCLGDTTVLSNGTAGGTWASSDASVATINAAGTVTSVAAGTTLISYTVTNTCGSATTTLLFTVNTLPAAGTITGNTPVCVGSTRALGNVVTGGVWASANPSVATIGTSGIVTGVAMGIDTISYTTTNACGSTTITEIVTVDPLPAAIVGASTVCNGMDLTMTNDSAGGTWSGTSGVAVGSATGVVTAVASGTATISYTLATGCYVTKAVTVATSPKIITGTKNICQGATVTLTDTTTGGTWSTADANISVGSTTGVVSGITPGTATVSYTISNGCFRTATVTVNISPGPIVGDSTVCRLLTTTWTNSVPGGTWSSSNPVLARVGSTTGVITGMGTGTVLITYRMPGACIVFDTIRILTAPQPVTGTLTLCEGATTTLSSTTYGGVWISGNTSVAAVVSPTGVLGGVAAGTSTVSYALGNGCFKSAVVTVNPLPIAITGVDQVCAGSNITLSTPTTGGLWSASTSAVTVGSASGIVTGVSAGVATVTYRIAATGCRRTMIVTVNPVPSSITGTSTACVEGTTLFSSTPLTGSWSSSDTTIATVGSAAGLVTGVAPGSARITYTLPVTGCFRTAPVSVNPLPAEITGPDSVCVGVSVSLASTTSGGSWTSSNAAVATVGTSGSVTGVASGTSAISYTLPLTGCARVHVVTVNDLPYPGLLSSPYNVCQSGTMTVIATVSGGTWSATTGNVSVAATGVVSGITPGLDTINYNVTGVCGISTVRQHVTVDPLPDPGAITGSFGMCIGGSTLLGKTITGGVWSTTGTSVATVAATGEVSGVAPGTAVISYTRTNLCGSSSATVEVTVHALAVAGSVTGIDSICIGDTTVMVNSVGGGVWLSNADWIAKVFNASGIVEGLFPGKADIMYVVSNSCSSDTARHTIVVKTQLECETGVAGVEHATPNFRLYPNPATASVNIESGSAGVLEIYALDGRMVKSVKVEGRSAVISLSDSLAAGVYMCRFTGTDGSINAVRLVLEP